MSDKNNATCAICGKGYVMCYSCSKKDSSMMWKIHCDTPEHYKVFQVINGYTTGVYDTDEAAKKLHNIDLSDMSCFRDNIKDIINKILDTSEGNSNAEVDTASVTSDESDVVDSAEPEKASEESEKPEGDEDEKVEHVAVKHTRRNKQTSVN